MAVRAERRRGGEAESRTGYREPAVADSPRRARRRPFAELLPGRLSQLHNVSTVSASGRSCRPLPGEARAGCRRVASASRGPTALWGESRLRALLGGG